MICQKAFSLFLPILSNNQNFTLGDPLGVLPGPKKFMLNLNKF